MSATSTRLISAFILILLVSLCLYLGAPIVIPVIMAIGVLTLDEMYYNFLKLDRRSTSYILGMASFVIIYVFYISLMDIVPIYVSWALGLLFCTLMLVNLFCLRHDDRFVIEKFAQFPLLLAIVTVLPLISLAGVFYLEHWRHAFILLLFINYGMDIGGWFFGKLYGKRKLWPLISPNKTFEGLLGGIFLSASLGQIYYFFAWGRWDWPSFLVFGVLGGLSQLGDLSQSKLKRQCGIKDSSSLIPGHGGVYDRIDSLIFLAPIYFAWTHFHHLGF